MKQKPSIRTLPLCIATILFSLAVVPVALAGPPLICHPFEIGNAKSLPVSGTGWNLSVNENYDTKSLVPDTLAILDGNPQIIVRMETLRRATLYAQKDPQAARELLTKLHARASRTETAGQQSALAWFDVGYLAATYDQWMRDPNPAAGVDAYGLIKKALALRGADPQMEFAAALITLKGPEKQHLEHLQRAIAGSKTDALLAQNLASHSMGTEKQAALSAPANSTAAKDPRK